MQHGTLNYTFIFCSAGNFTSDMTQILFWPAVLRQVGQNADIRVSVWVKCELDVA